MVKCTYEYNLSSKNENYNVISLVNYIATCVWNCMKLYEIVWNSIWVHYKDKSLVIWKQRFVICKMSLQTNWSNVPMNCISPPKMKIYIVISLVKLHRHVCMNTADFLFEEIIKINLLLTGGRKDCHLTEAITLRKLVKCTHT